MENKIHCLICKTDIKSNLQVFGRCHLKKEHNITPKEYYDKFIKKTHEGKCEVCKSATNFVNIKIGYYDNCSSKCVALNKKTKEKSQKTKQEKYGDVNYNNRSKAKKTLQNSHGVINVSQIKSIKNKKKKTLLKNYGVDNPLKSETIKSKIKNTCLEKYGVDNPTKSAIIKHKRSKTMLDKYGADNFSKTLDYRKLKEELGEWVPLENKSDFEIYSLLVWKETNKYKKILFKEWDGCCYYTKEKLVINNENYNDPLYATIDHKKSIYWGFKNSVLPNIIGGINNLCICSRYINSVKNLKTEKQFNNFLKLKNNV